MNTINKSKEVAQEIYRKGNCIKELWKNINNTVFNILMISSFILFNPTKSMAGHTGLVTADTKWIAVREVIDELSWQIRNNKWWDVWLSIARNFEPTQSSELSVWIGMVNNIHKAGYIGWYKIINNKYSLSAFLGRKEYKSWKNSHLWELWAWYQVTPSTHIWISLKTVDSESQDMLDKDMLIPWTNIVKNFGSFWVWFWYSYNDKLEGADKNFFSLTVWIPIWADWFDTDKWIKPFPKAKMMTTGHTYLWS